MSKHAVTFVGICYQETNEIHMFIGMLLCQKNKNWKAIIYHDGPNKWMKEQVAKYKDKRISYVENKENTGSWGCYNRIKALDIVDTEYITNCTIQEYYLPIAVDQILNYPEADIIYWDTIHHSFGYNILPVALQQKRIDWSNFAMRTSIAQEVGINQPTAYCADGIFIEDCLKSGKLKKGVQVPRILSIKN